MADYRLRPADLKSESERAFIFDGWLKSFKKSSYSGIIPNNRYTEVLTDAIYQLIARGMQILLLESPTYGNYLGFIAFEDAEIPVIHYVFVKPMLQGTGLGKKMILAAGVTPDEPWLYTFRTRAARKFKNGIFCKAVACRKNLQPVSRSKRAPNED